MVGGRKITDTSSLMLHSPGMLHPRWPPSSCGQWQSYVHTQHWPKCAARPWRTLPGCSCDWTGSTDPVNVNRSANKCLQANRLKLPHIYSLKVSHWACIITWTTFWGCSKKNTIKWLSFFSNWKHRKPSQVHFLYKFAKKSLGRNLSPFFISTFPSKTS